MAVLRCFYRHVEHYRTLQDIVERPAMFDVTPPTAPTAPAHCASLASIPGVLRGVYPAGPMAQYTGGVTGVHRHRGHSASWPMGLVSAFHQRRHPRHPKPLPAGQPATLKNSYFIR
jgi:hypothetical protein